MTEKAKKRRFTFAMAKEKIKQLEAELEAAKADIKEDTKIIGAGDILFAVGGLLLGFVIGALL